MQQENVISSPPKIIIFSGGTMVHVAPHFSLCAPAYSKIGDDILYEFYNHRAQNFAAWSKIDNRAHHTGDNIRIYKTRMANSHNRIETNDDLKIAVEKVLEDKSVKYIIMAAAICDFEPMHLRTLQKGSHNIDEDKVTLNFGKDQERLDSSEIQILQLAPSEKIVDIIKKERPDIHLTTFKTTSGKDEIELHLRCKKNLERSKSDIVFGNDIKNEINMLVTNSNYTFCLPRRECVELLVEKIFKHMQQNNPEQYYAL